MFQRAIDASLKLGASIPCAIRQNAEFAPYPKVFMICLRNLNMRANPHDAALACKLRLQARARTHGAALEVQARARIHGAALEVQARAETFLPLRNLDLDFRVS